METCFAKWDDANLVEASEAMWKGMITYYLNPNPKDPWVNCEEDPNNSRCHEKLWREARSRAGLGHFGKGNWRYIAMEKCNFVSNIAYYHSATRLCDYEDWGFDDSYKRALK